MSEQSDVTQTGDPPARRAGDPDRPIAHHTSSPVLRAADISVAYGGVTVLEDVSLDLTAGSVTTLLGPNGSGKTTLIRVLAGLETPDGGSVTVDAEGDRIVGYHPQRPAFRPHETVREVMAHYAAIAGDETPVHERLRAVGIADVADRRVDALSGGMVRLLAVAQATIGDPPVVLLDEPTSDLDPDMSGRIAEVIADLADAGAAVLAVTHDLLAVETIADTIVLLDRGEVVAKGSPHTIQGDANTDSLAAAFSALTRGEEGPWTVRAGGGHDTATPSRVADRIDGMESSTGDDGFPSSRRPQNDDEHTLTEESDP